MKPKIKIYLSGPISNNPNYKEDFKTAESTLKSLKDYDIEVINPAALNALLPSSTTYEEYMKIDLMYLDLCNSIYMLKGWENSRGANREYGYALAKEKAIVFESQDSTQGLNIEETKL